MAQPEAGHFTITPTAGVSSCTVTNHPEIDFASYLLVHTGGNYDERHFYSFQLAGNDKCVTGWSAGLDFGYQISDRVGLSAGAYYSRQGMKFEDIDYDCLPGQCACVYVLNENTATFNLDDRLPAHTHHTELGDITLALGYLNVPVTVKYYVLKGLAVNAGFQWGYCISKKLSYSGKAFDESFENGGDGELVFRQTIITDDGLTSEMIIGPQNGKTTDVMIKNNQFSVPVGLSYEYNGFVMEFRYCHYLNDAWNSKEVNQNNTAESVCSNSRNQVLTLSLGYRFDLGK